MCSADGAERRRVARPPNRAGGVHPVEKPDELSRLLAAARDEVLAPFVFALLCLDAGLRSGEALGLRWGAFGGAIRGARRAGSC
jgi:integrase